MAQDARGQTARPSADAVLRVAAGATMRQARTALCGYGPDAPFAGIPAEAF